MSLSIGNHRRKNPRPEPMGDLNARERRILAGPTATAVSPLFSACMDGTFRDLFDKYPGEEPVTARLFLKRRDSAHRGIDFTILYDHGKALAATGVRFTSEDLKKPNDTRPSALGTAIKTGRLREVGHLIAEGERIPLADIAAETRTDAEREKAFYGADGGMIETLAKLGAFSSTGEMKRWRENMPAPIAAAYGKNEKARKTYAGLYATFSRREVRPRSGLPRHRLEGGRQ